MPTQRVPSLSRHLLQHHTAASCLCASLQLRCLNAKYLSSHSVVPRHVHLPEIQARVVRRICNSSFAQALLKLSPEHETLTDRYDYDFGYSSRFTVLPGIRLYAGLVNRCMIQPHADEGRNKDVSITIRNDCVYIAGSNIELFTRDGRQHLDDENTIWPPAASGTFRYVLFVGYFPEPGSLVWEHCKGTYVLHDQSVLQSSSLDNYDRDRWLEAYYERKKQPHSGIVSTLGTDAKATLDPVILPAENVEHELYVESGTVKLRPRTLVRRAKRKIGAVSFKVGFSPFFEIARAADAPPYELLSGGAAVDWAISRCSEDFPKLERIVDFLEDNGIKIDAASQSGCWMLLASGPPAVWVTQLLPVVRGKLVDFLVATSQDGELYVCPRLNGCWHRLSINGDTAHIETAFYRIDPGTSVSCLSASGAKWLGYCQTIETGNASMAVARTICNTLTPRSYHCG